MLAKDDKDLQELIDEIARGGAAPDMLESMSVTRDHLKALTEMLDITLTRSFLVLERLGYDPENPPSNVVQFTDY